MGQTIAGDPRCPPSAQGSSLGRWREAEEALLHVLAESSDAWVHDHDDLLRESVATGEHHLAWLSVDCNVVGAELLVNGASAGRLPLSAPLRIDAGAVVIQVRAEGHEAILRRAYVSEGARVRESIVLVASPPLPSVARITADRGAARRTAAWLTLGTGGVVVAGGVAAAVTSLVYIERYNDPARCFVWPLTRDQRCGSDRGVAEAMRVTSVVTFVTGGVALGAGAYLLFTRPEGEPVEPPKVACAIGLGSLRCGGHF